MMIVMEEGEVEPSKDEGKRVKERKGRLMTLARWC
jgi:hypothetical protein